MSHSERVLTFSCEGTPLLGIVSAPANPGAVPGTGVVIIVGGPQYRAGSHRQFVHLARALAEAGIPVLRFDCRGMGDSGGAQRSFDGIDADIRAAIDAFQADQPCVKRIVLWGLCDGASAALLYVRSQADPRVTGLCLANPWVRTEATLAKAQIKHYYTARLKQPEFWKKLLSGGVAFKALRDLAGNLRASRGKNDAGTSDADKPFQQRMAEGWGAFEGQVLLLLSENDLVAKEFSEYTASDPAWRKAFARRPASPQALQGLDHTFSSAASRAQVEAQCLAWLASSSIGYPP